MHQATDSADQIYLILAVVLLQTIGLFHQQPDQRASSSIYHGMLVMVGNSVQVSINTVIILIDDSADWDNGEECSLGTGGFCEWVSGSVVAGMGGK